MTEISDAKRRHCFWGHLARAERMVLAMLDVDRLNEDEPGDTFNALAVETDFDDCENCWDSIAYYLAEQLAYYRTFALAAGVPPQTATRSTNPNGFDVIAGHQAAITETCDCISDYLALADEKNPPPTSMPRIFK